MSPAKSATLFLLVLLATLSACQTPAPPPPPLPKIVEVPVPTPCTPDPKLLPQRNPQRAFESLPPTATLYEKARALLIDRSRDIPTIDALWVALDGCSTLPKP